MKPFSLVGVVWDDARSIPQGQLQVQTRASGGERWSGWRPLNTHGDHGPDPGSAERSGTSKKALGATAPLWVGDSRAVRVRIVPRAESPKTTGSSNSRQARKAELPRGARLELVDPGDSDPAAKGAEQGKEKDAPGGQGKQGEEPEPPGGAAGVPGGTLPALTKARTRATYGDEAADATPSKTDRPEDTHIGPRPRIITRKGWGADEKLRERSFGYTAPRQGGVRAPHGRANNYTLRAGPFGHPRYLPLPRQEQRLARHRLQLPRRQVRKHLRGPRRRRGQGRDGRPHPRLQHRTARASPSSARYTPRSPAAKAATDAVARLDRLEARTLRRATRAARHT